ncbi:hypothetical protein AX16_009065 [Volvariella volvacea WC 439]|nr:hypothetical protein AX16_009065 [Volvariella volvacea WC 439]
MVIEGRLIDGREFHPSDSNYSLPVDYTEHQRLGLLHTVLLEAAGNYLAPLHECSDGRGPSRIVDLCCGSGHWIIDMAQEFPSAEVIGLDIVTPKPGVPLPPNCKFISGNATMRLPFDDSSVDYVQMRTVPSLPERVEILKEIGRVLKPGGFVGFIEPSASFSGKLNARSPMLIEVDRLMMESPHTPKAKVTTKDGNKTWSIASLLKGLIESAVNQDGSPLFEAVHDKTFLVPIGPWPQDPAQARIGAMNAEVQINLVKAFGPLFLKNNLLTAAEFDKLFEEVKKEVADLSLELQIPFTYAWGRRRQ